jgi:hypothetical protein
MDEMGHIKTGNIGPHQSISEWNESNRRKEMEFGLFYGLRFRPVARTYIISFSNIVMTANNKAVTG